MIIVVSKVSLQLARSRAIYIGHEYIHNPAFAQRRGNPCVDARTGADPLVTGLSLILPPLWSEKSPLKAPVPSWRQLIPLICPSPDPVRRAVEHKASAPVHSPFDAPRHP